MYANSMLFRDTISYSIHRFHVALDIATFITTGEVGFSSYGQKVRIKHQADPPFLDQSFDVRDNKKLKKNFR